MEDRLLCQTSTLARRDSTVKGPVAKVLLANGLSENGLLRDICVLGTASQELYDQASPGRARATEPG